MTPEEAHIPALPIQLHSERKLHCLQDRSLLDQLLKQTFLSISREKREPGERRENQVSRLSGSIFSPFGIEEAKSSSMVQVLDYGTVPARKLEDRRHGAMNSKLVLTAVAATCALAFCVTIAVFRVSTIIKQAVLRKF
jgi:hypothetical protein